METHLGNEAIDIIFGKVIGVRDVVIDGHVEELAILVDVADLFAETIDVMFIDILSVDHDHSIFDGVIAHNQLDEGRFTITAIANECDVISCGYVER